MWSVALDFESIPSHDNFINFVVATLMHSMPRKCRTMFFSLHELAYMIRIVCPNPFTICISTDQVTIVHVAITMFDYDNSRE